MSVAARGLKIQTDGSARSKKCYKKYKPRPVKLGKEAVSVDIKPWGKGGGGGGVVAG
jgi:hypothetical protein